MKRLISCMLAKGLYSYLTQSLSIVYDTGRKNYILMLNLCHVPIDCLVFFFRSIRTVIHFEGIFT